MATKEIIDASDAMVTQSPSLPQLDSVRHKSVHPTGTSIHSEAVSTIVKSPTKGQLIKTPDTTLFCRYELKYRITETKARALAQYVQAYIHPDRYAKSQPGYEYPISSLYLDSPTMSLCRETLQGKKNRFKLRVRGYDDSPESPVFLEVKRRINTVILKSRVKVPKPVLGQILSNRHAPSLEYEKDRETFRQFMLYVTALNARPVVLVRYMRQAFEGDSDNRVRITFDRKLGFKATGQPVVSVNGPGWHAVSMDFVILEIKFTARYPLWLSDMVKMFNLKQTAMSKYVSSVQQSCELGFCSIGLEQVWCYDE